MLVLRENTPKRMCLGQPVLILARESPRRGVFFVTRLKKSADYEVLDRRALPSRAGAVRRDEVIFFHSLAASGSSPVFRRIEYFDAEQERTLVFLTNHLKFAATTLAATGQRKVATAAIVTCRCDGLIGTAE